MAEAKAMIYEAITKTMQDVGAVGKTDKNEFDKYMFRGIDAVMNALHPAMVKNGIFAVPTVMDAKREERTGKNGTVMMYSVLTVKYTFYAKDGSFVESVVIGEAMDRSDKSTNKAMSAAFKYACFQTFCIPTEELLDSEMDSLEMGTKSDEQKNKEMKDSVDQRLIVPKDNVMTKAQYEYLMSEINRTGSMADVVKYAGSEDLTTLPASKCVALLNGLIKRPSVGAK